MLVVLVYKFLKESLKDNTESNSLPVSKRRMSVFVFFMGGSQILFYLTNGKAIINLCAGVAFILYGLYLFFTKQDD